MYHFCHVHMFSYPILLLIFPLPPFLVDVLRGWFVVPSSHFFTLCVDACSLMVIKDYVLMQIGTGVKVL